MGAPQSVKSCAANCQKSMSNIETRAHWENLYQTKGEHEVSWFQESPTISLELIRATGVNTDASITPGRSPSSGRLAFEVARNTIEFPVTRDPKSRIACRRGLCR
jgi:hypothetical protein